MENGKDYCLEKMDMRITRIADNIQRLTADNGGVFTGPGTNTYLVGNEEISIIDPGPDLSDHIDDIEKIGMGNISKILITHTHPDHAPGAKRLSKRLNLPIYGYSTDSSKQRDLPINIDVSLTDQLTIESCDHSIIALHTPGHASNHFCYLSDGFLFTGDHVMQGSTVVISPPDGNMSEYLNSLELIKSFDIKIILPGHGDPINKPYDEIDAIINHRLERENKVIIKLKESSPVDIESLLKEVYDDVKPFLHPIALHSLEAHLIRLIENNLATFDGHKYTLVE
jgi:glyoxylase-like metal-dependent hydrolase (beta-lactamase superfamily II)